jgi:spore coat polysaccharide biosynthesis predicted glycosyltransferase SpsG
MAHAGKGRVRVVAHCRADPRIGMGHAVRLGALLQHLPTAWELVCCVDRELAEPHFPQGATFLPADPAAVAGAVHEGTDAGDLAVLVVDLPRNEPRYWRLGGERVLTVAIDDNGGFGMAADIVINQGDIAKHAQYPDLPAHSVVVSGLENVLLRRGFSASEAPARAGVGFVAGSGESSRRWIAAIVRDLAGEGFGPVRVVVSETLADAADLAAIGRARSIEVASGLSAAQMRDFYRRCELCVMTGGSAIFEAMATGTPVLCHPILDDMLEPTRRLAAMGALVALSRAEAGPGAIERIIVELLADKRRLEEIGARAASRVDGRGCERVAALLERVAGRWAAGQAKTAALATEKGR